MEGWVRFKFKSVRKATSDETGRKGTVLTLSGVFKCTTQQECPSECRSEDAVAFYTPRSLQWAPGPRAKACSRRGGRTSSASPPRLGFPTRLEWNSVWFTHSERMSHNRGRKYSSRRVCYNRAGEVGGSCGRRRRRLRRYRRRRRRKRRRRRDVHCKRRRRWPWLRAETRGPFFPCSPRPPPLPPAAPRRGRRRQSGRLGAVIIRGRIPARTESFGVWLGARV